MLGLLRLWKKDSQIMESFFQASRQLRQVMRSAKTYLIVDDDDILANLIEMILKGFNVPVKRVSTLAAAKEFIENRKPENIACVIVDVIFPQDSGVGFVFWLQSNYPEIPFFIYTNADVEKIRKELRDLGVSGQVLAKHESIEKLIEALGIF